MSASPEFFNPAAGLAPRLLLAAAAKGGVPSAADDDEEYFLIQTPKGAGISILGDAATCPPAPMKPRLPPASTCKKRLFAPAANVVRLRFQDLDAIFRPLSDGTQRRRRSERNNLGADSRRSAASIS